MARTPRSTAQDEHYHLVLTVWQSRDHRRMGGSSLCAATGALSASGAYIELDGRVYPPILDPKTKATMMFSTIAQSVTASLAWDRESMDPIDLDLTYAVGELALVDEASGGTTTRAWSQRRVLARGRVSSYEWGDDRQALTMTIAGTQLIDSGNWYAPGAELSSDRFADIDNTGKRDRAPKANGKLPPMVWAPAGSQILVPAYTVVDEVDAISAANPGGPVNIAYARLLLGYRRPTNTLSAEQFQVPDSDREGVMLGGNADVAYQSTPASAQDLLGDTYWYCERSFVETFGSASVTFTTGSDSATATKSRRFCRAGWQVRYTGDGADDWVVAISVDGSAVELGDSNETPINYGGAGGVNGTGDALPLPGDSLDSVYWIPKLGGIAGADGTAISKITDVIKDWLRLARFDVPVCYGDLDALRSRLAGIDISWVTRQRGSPWAKCLDVMRYVPIRPYLSDGVLRFRWVGPVTHLDVVTTIDLDEIGSAYRSEPVKWSDQPTYPLIHIDYWRDAFTSSFTRSFDLDGSIAGWANSKRVPVGRAVEAYAAWQDISGQKTADRCPTLSLELDTLATGHGIHLAAMWLLYRWGAPRYEMSLDIAAELRWLEVGDVICATETGVTRRAALWRVEGIVLDGQGGGRLLLESASGVAKRAATMYDGTAVYDGGYTYG